jgi:lysophospholipase L1-like esterase
MRSVVLRASMGALVAACVLGLCEIGLRMAGVRPAYSAARMGLWQTEPKMENRRIRGNREPHDFVVNTNESGLRTKVSAMADLGTFRVAVMGDSNVFGWGVNDGATFASVAQRQLRTLGVAEAEVINAGQPGYSTAQIQWFFAQKVQAYKPDLTIVFVSLHDFNRTLISDNEARLGGAGLRAKLRVGLAQESRIYEWLRRRLFPLWATVQLLPSDAPDATRVPRVSDAERAMLLDDMRTLAESWGGAVTVGLLPDYSDLTRPVGPPAVPKVSAAWALAYGADRGLEPVDLRESCVGLEADSLVFSYDQDHMNAAGHKVVGEALAQELYMVSTNPQ